MKVLKPCYINRLIDMNNCVKTRKANNFLLLNVLTMLSIPPLKLERGE
jgi:hypothetical protein